MTQRSRRTFLQAAAASAVALPMINFASYAAPAGGSKKYSARVMKLVQRSLVIDMLGVLKMDITSAAWNGTLSEAAVKEFRDSGVTVLHNAVGLGGSDAYVEAVNFFAQWNGFMARNSDLFLLVNRLADIERAKASGKIAVIMGLQNAEHFRTVDDVVPFHDLGQRCSQLTYNSQNYYASGSTDRIDGGVSDAGAALIQKMNDVGMLVDVSHCGDKTTLDAMDISKKPIAITHANCRALNNHPRLKTDEAIKKLAATGGVMGITGVRNFVRDKEPTTVEHIVDHIDHVVKIAGIEHVGIGSDSDLNGSDDMPPEQLKLIKSYYKASYAFRDKIDTDGFDSPLRFYDLTDALVRRGYSDANIEAILGGNFRRLLGQVMA
jgi:membrane dipeptidase